MYSEAVDEGGDQIDGDEDGQNAAGPDATTRLPSMRLKDLQSHGKAMKTTDLLRVLETEVSCIFSYLLSVSELGPAAMSVWPTN